MRKIRRKTFPTIRLVGLLLIILGSTITIYFQVQLGKAPEQALSDFLENIVGVEFFGMGLTVFLIDWLYERRDEREKKHQLIRELGSIDRILSNRAALELSSKNWLSDGTLKGAILLNANLEKSDLDDANFSFCNLEGVNFRSANLGGADFRNANLKNADFSGSFLEEVDFSSAIILNADFTSANLRNAKFVNSNLWQTNFENAYLQDCSFNKSDLKGVNFQGTKYLSPVQLLDVGELRGAILPDGQSYDGRYKLLGDLAKAKERNIDINDDTLMAEFYGVTLEAYRSGLNHLE